jgi:hypothetical protein
MATSGAGGGADFFAAAAIAPSPARQSTPSATALITWEPLCRETPSLVIKLVQNEAALPVSLT